MLAAAVISLLLAGVLYLLAVQNRAGQTIDETAFEGRETEPASLRRDANDLLHTITTTTLPMVGGVVVLIALARGRPRLAIAGGGVIAGAVFTSETLKRLLPRPELIEIANAGHNSFPSGHATIAMSIGLALVMAVPPRRRGLAALAAAVFAVSFGMAAVVAGWHRPSDVLAAYCVALAWASLMAIILIRWADRESRERTGKPIVGSALFALGAVLLLSAYTALIAALLIQHGHKLTAIELHDDLLIAIGFIASAGLLVIALYLFLIRGHMFDHQTPRHT